MELKEISSYFTKLYIHFNEHNDESNLANVKNILQYINVINSEIMKKTKISHCMIVTSWYNLYAQPTCKINWQTVYDEL